MAHSIICKNCGHNIGYPSSKIGNTTNCPKCQNSVLLTAPEDVENPRFYYFPQLINVQIVDQENINLEIPHIAIVLKRGSLLIGPFFTDESGKVLFKNEDYEDAKSASMSADLWGSKYRNWDQVGSVSIHILSELEINKMIEGRKENWSFLLSNEEKKWDSFDEFILALRNSNNDKVEPVEEFINLQNIQQDSIINLRLRLSLKESK